MFPRSLTYTHCDTHLLSSPLLQQHLLHSLCVCVCSFSLPTTQVWSVSFRPHPTQFVLENFIFRCPPRLLWNCRQNEEDVVRVYILLSIRATRKSWGWGVFPYETFYNFAIVQNIFFKKKPERMEGRLGRESAGGKGGNGNLYLPQQRHLHINSNWIDFTSELK